MDPFTQADDPDPLSTAATSPNSRGFRPARAILRRLYSSNPFYVISADLIFVGLRMSLDTNGTTFEAGALMLALAGYTLLLATLACFLIRFGQVWDDVRTILLLVVMMFLAISVTFDETLAGSNPRLGIACDLGGLLFSILASEAVQRSIRLRLPWLFRGPYYLILALFFVYPAALVPLLGDPTSPRLQGALYGFSPLAGLVFLSLLPAIRRGPGYVAGNGSPWRFPLYPWILFGLLAMAVCGRAFYLCISLHSVDRTARYYVEQSHTIFGLHFLVPFLFALLVLWLELGIVSRSRFVLRIAITAPLGLLGLAIAGPSPDPVFEGFVQSFMAGTGGSPLFLALVACVVYLAYARVRGVPLAVLEGLSFALLMLSVVGPTTRDLDGLVPVQSQPILALGVLQLWLACRERVSGRCLFAAACLVVGLTISLGRADSLSVRTAMGSHLALAAILIMAAVFDDPLGRLLRGAGALLLGSACLISALVGDPWLCAWFEVSPQVMRAYPLALVALATGYGLAFGGRAYLVAATFGLGGWLGFIGFRGYLYLRQFIAGLDRIAWGLAFLLLASTISLTKTGWPRRWLESKPEPSDSLA